MTAKTEFSCRTTSSLIGVLSSFARKEYMPTVHDYMDLAHEEADQIVWFLYTVLDAFTKGRCSFNIGILPVNHLFYQWLGQQSAVHFHTVP